MSRKAYSLPVSQVNAMKRLPLLSLKLLAPLCLFPIALPVTLLLFSERTAAQNAPSSPATTDAATLLAEAGRLREQGIQQVQGNQFQSAFQSLGQALRLYQDPGVQAAFPQESRIGESLVIARLGSASLQLGNYEQAIALLQQAVLLFREVRSTYGAVRGLQIEEGQALGNLGIAYRESGQYEQAIEVLLPRLALARELDDPVGEGAALGNLGLAYEGLGQYEQAIDFYQQRLVNARARGDRFGEGLNLGNMAAAYASWGRYEQAIEAHQQALIIARELGERNEIYRNLRSLGDIYLTLNQYEQAIEIHEQHLALARELSDRFGVAASLNSLGLAYAGLNQYDQAIEFYEQSLTIAREINNRQGEVTAFGNLGNAYSALEQYDRALEFYKQALTIAREVGDYMQEGGILQTISLIADRLVQEGHQEYQESHFQGAIESWQQALRLYQDIEFYIQTSGTTISADQSLQEKIAIALNNLGAAFNNLGTQQYNSELFSDALESFEQALEIYQNPIVPGSQAISQTTVIQTKASIVGSLGNIYYLQGEYARAVDFYEQVLVLARELGDRQIESTALSSLGNSYDALENYTLAIDFLEQALAIAQEDDNDLNTALYLDNLGNAYSSLYQYEQARIYYEQALDIRRIINDSPGILVSLESLGRVYYHLGEDQKSIEVYEEVLFIRQSLNDRQGEINALRSLGIAHNNLNNYSQAINYHQQALSIARELSDPMEEAGALRNLANVYSNLDDIQQVINLNTQALEIFQAIGYQSGEAGALDSLGITYASTDQYDQALNFLQASLNISREIGDRSQENTTLNNLGQLYIDLGQPQRGITLYEQSLEISREIGDLRGQALTLSNLSSIYFQLDRVIEAFEFHNESIELVNRIGDKSLAARIWISYGNLYLFTQLGSELNIVDGAPQISLSFDEGLVAYSNALAIYREIGDRQSEAITLSNLGFIYLFWVLSEVPEQNAINFFEQSLTIAREVNDPALEARTLQHLGSAYWRLNRYAEAEASFLAAINILESLRSGELEDLDKISLFDTQLDAYIALQNLLIIQGNFEEALVVAERGRARVLLESLAQRASVQMVQAISSTVPDLEEIRRIAQTQDATLVSYFVDNTSISRPKLYIWVVQPSGEIVFQTVALGPEVPRGEFAETEDGELTFRTTEGQEPGLAELVAITRDVLNARGRSDTASVDISPTPQAQERQRQEQQLALQQLYNLLIEPIAQYLPTDPTDRVIIIPHQDLFMVPFPALVNAEGEYLIENHTLLTAPSIQVLDVTGRSPNPERSRLQGDDLLIVGNPIMPSVWNPNTNQSEPLSSLVGAEAEAQSIADAFGTDALLWEAASESTVVARMPSARVIHLATHGLLEYGIPEESGVRDLPGAIALAPGNGEDGLLTSAEIFELSLQAELVVLSACDTGRGRITGDGVVGLSRAFMQAGVPSLIVSLWKVPDDATAFLMTEFYENWQNTPDRAQALRQAMLTTMEQYPDPLNWAAFTLVGQAE